ncbi:MAG: Tetraacyldisaccharide 4'-kinase [Candidatus Kapaibacterium sp.]|jgi:tetraacyldisaccharide 4'-kinase|nr:MAG: Tetraacyldisaccharide 4'-kinase [Candidatus Kapabacteria bacterium]ROL56936.1 MAG: tetraacyldisaccharide 4'-kinase [Bacteroidetes/Chlorobi group bacterium Naka2016]
MILKLINSAFFPFVSIKNFLYDKGLLRQVKSKFLVVSVGNISFGGTGKTTFIIHLSKKLLERNIRPLVLSKGYRRKSDETIIFPHEGVEPNVESIGDEMFLIYSKLDIPFAVSNRKYEAIEKIDNNFNPDVILIDDGFQHRKLYRDIDIVLIDNATPNTILREPIKNIDRADVVLIEENTNIDLGRYKGNFELFTFRRFIKKFYGISKKILNIENLSEGKVVLVSGIGNNKGFLNSMKKYFKNIVSHLEFKDHHYYTSNDINKIVLKTKKLNADVIVTTEKDFVKLIRFKEIFECNNINLITSEVDLEIDQEDRLIEMICTEIFQRRTK